MYGNLVELANEHLTEICQTAANIIRTKKISQYQDFAPELLAQHFHTELQMQLRYLETSNLSEWQSFIEKAVLERLIQGLDYTSIVKAEQCLTEALGQFFQGIPLEGDEAGKIQVSLQRRLQGIHIVASSVAIRVGLKFRQEKINSGRYKGGLN